MSKYEQLSEAYSLSKQANLEYWVDLKRMVDRVRRDFCAFLDVSSSLQIPSNGSSLPVVSIGSLGEKGQFANWALDNLPRSDRSIEFALRLVVSGETGSEPEPSIVFHLSIKRTPSGYPVVVKSDPGEPEFNGPVYNELFAYLFKSAMDSLSAKK